ncbi:MAG: cytidylate kinase [Flavobacteriaceae bacterium]|nr:cytidylate kinase [Flavobacteriaceae bacterium]|tara:strand:- start:8503 stop:9201 length:699 start_codon:yes stop_codon:yes gene_type:complete
MTNNKKITIAIDGFSSTGKSTIAKLVAKKYNYVYVDTGAMYRAVALYGFKNGFVGKDFLDEAGLTGDLNKIDLDFKYNIDLGFAEIYLNGENVEKAIRTLEVSELVSKVAAISAVRKKLVKEQQKMGVSGGIVMDGRDIGTVVFPDAELKIYMIASAKTRAERRYQELREKGEDVDYHDVLRNVMSRDVMDSTREDSPLMKADDAIEFDNSDLTIDQQYEKICALIDKRLAS